MSLVRPAEIGPGSVITYADSTVFVLATEVREPGSRIVITAVTKDMEMLTFPVHPRGYLWQVSAPQRFDMEM